MKIARFLFVIFFSFNLFTQDLNEAFLQNLPDSISNALSETNEQEKDEELFQQSPQTRLKKLAANLDELKQDIDNVEAQVYVELGMKSDEVLARFGEAFFNTFQTSFAPINEPTATSSYVVDSGDILKVQLVGNAFNDVNTLKIERDGSINLPDIGKIHVAGLSFSDVQEKVGLEVNEISFGTKVFITLVSLRDMNISIIGGINYPGSYTLPGGSNVIAALIAAGGISDRGSYRKIDVKRKGANVNSYDLYDFFSKGILNNFQLMNGDVLIVHPKGKEVFLSGGISFPAIYELLDNENLTDVINLAGGITPAALQKEVIIERAALTSTHAPESGAALEYGDVIYVPMHIPAPDEQKSITITGAVKKPGVYSFNSGDTFSNIIERAGGYQENAYPFGGMLHKQSVADIQKEYFDNAYNDLINFLATGTSKSGPLGSSNLANSSNLQFLLSQLKSIKPKGRVTMEFNLNKIKDNPSLDTILSDKDRIHIPFFTNEVTIVGEVLLPGGRVYDPSLQARDYIESAGGLTKFADSNRVILINPKGQAETINNNLSLSFFVNGNDQSIYPGSVIYIPREMNKIEGINLAATIAPIVSSLAISAASLNAINN